VGNGEPWEMGNRGKWGTVGNGEPWEMGNRGERSLPHLSHISVFQKHWGDRVLSLSLFLTLSILHTNKIKQHVIGHTSQIL
jgi:hypothetical protein